MMNILTKVVQAVPNWIMSYSPLVRPVRTTPPYSRAINRTKTLTFADPNFENKEIYFKYGNIYILSSIHSKMIKDYFSWIQL